MAPRVAKMSYRRQPYCAIWSPVRWVEGAKVYVAPARWGVVLEDGSVEGGLGRPRSRARALARCGVQDGKGEIQT